MYKRQVSERPLSTLTPGQLSTAIRGFNDKQNLSGPAKEQRDTAVAAAADQSVGSFADIQKRLDKLEDADGKAVYTDEEDRDAEAQRIRNSGIAVANDKFVRRDLNGLRAEVNLPSMEDEWDLREEARKIMVEIDDPSQWSNPDNPQPVVVLQRDGTFKVGTDVEHPPTDYIDDFLESLSHDELTSFVNTKNQNWDWRNLYRMRGLEDTRLSWVVPEDLSGWQRGHQVTEAHEAVFLGGGEVIPIALRRR